MGSEQARLRSPEALARVRAALIKFAEEAAGALDESDAQIGRGQQWLTREQPMHWKQVHRKATDIVNNRRSDVYRKQLQGVDRQASAVEEKKALENAKRKMAEAERVMTSIKSWAVKLERASMLYRGQSQRLRSFLSVEVPNAVSALDSMASSIEAYLHDSVPNANTIAGGTGSGTQPVAGRVSTASLPAAEGFGAIANQTAALRAHTPDASERFGLDADEATDPLPDTVACAEGSSRDALTALIHVDRADDDAAKAGSDPQNMLVVIEGAACAADRIYAERTTPGFQTDSGWFVGDARFPRTPHANNALRTARIGALRKWLPGLSPMLDLPKGWMVVLERGTVVRVIAPDDSVVWTDHRTDTSDGGGS